MIKIPSFQGFEYTRMQHADLVAELKLIPNVNLHYLGTSFGGREINGFSIGDLKKPTIYIEGNVHGAHEWRTAHWVKKFMEIIANPSLSPAHTQIINALKAKYSFYFIPSCNPDGYVNYTYGNDNGVSITNNFDWRWNELEPQEGTPWYKGISPFSEPESRIIRDVILAIKPISVVCTHTWGGYTGFTVRHSYLPQYNKLLNDIYWSIYITSNESSETDSMFSTRLIHPSVYNWAGELTSRIGRKTFTMVLETGSNKTESEQARFGLNGLMLYCMYVDKLFTQNILRVDHL